MIEATAKNHATYTPAELGRLARAEVRAWKRAHPHLRPLDPDGWEIKVFPWAVCLVAYFRDEYGRHFINIAL